MKRFRTLHLRFRSKITVGAITLVTIPLLVSGFVAYRGSIDSLESVVETDLAPVARLGYQIVTAGGNAKPDWAAIERSLLSLKLGSTGYMYVMDGTGTMLLHPTLKGQSIASHDFAREIIAKAKTLSPGEVGSIRYDWINKERGETAPREKIAVFTYASSLDAIIVAGSYTNEFTDSPVRHLAFMLVLTLGISILVSTSAALGFGRMVAGPVLAMRKTAMAVAGGDLTQSVTVNSNDELGELGQGINGMIRDLGETITHFGEAIAAVASAASEISASTEEMAAGTHEQTSQAGEVASSVEEMTKTIVENSRNAGLTAERANRARQTAQDGGKIVEETVAGMKRIAEVVNQSAETVKALGKSTDQIGEIIGVVDDIADQTNLLALNAAIEAARAGEQGRGFSVVADEVRKLAERTSNATKEITVMIRQIQSETKGAVASMLRGTENVNEGIRLADRSGASLKEIICAIEEVTDRVNQIAAASEEQSSASEQISKNVESISAVTGESAKATEQIARTAEDLNRLTENLHSLVERFKTVKSDGHAGEATTGGDNRDQGKRTDARTAGFDLEGAKNGHMMWRLRIGKMISGVEKVTEADIVSHRDCKLGLWYYGPGEALYGNVQAFTRLGDAHEKMHNEVRKTIELWNCGKKTEATKAAEKVYSLSDGVIRCLDELKEYQGEHMHEEVVS